MKAPIPASSSLLRMPWHSAMQQSWQRCELGPQDYFLMRAMTFLIILHILSMKMTITAGSSLMQLRFPVHSASMLASSGTVGEISCYSAHARMGVKTGARHHCCSAYLTFVSVLARPGRDGRPARRMKRVIPTLPPHTEIHDAAER